MEQSAIEKEMLAFVLNFRYWLRSHDRGVIIGLLMSCVPIVPVTTIGLLLCIFNQHLLTKGRLDANEGHLIKVGLFISVVNIILGSLLAFYLLKSFSAVHWVDVFGAIKNNFIYLIEFIKSIFNSNHGGCPEFCVNVG